jgi:integrase
MRGHVRQRGSKWCYVVDLPPGLDGKRKQHWKGGFDSRKEAEQALVELLHSVDRGTFVARDRITVGQYLSSWLEGLQLAPASVYSYRKSINRHVIPTIGQQPLQQLDPAALRSFYALLQTDQNATGRALSGTSVQLIHQVLHRALNDAAREGVVVRNVASLVKPPRRSTQERETWSAGQLREFLTAVQPEHDYAMWLLFATTGMRRGEVCGLQWKDLDFAQERLLVRRSLGMIGGAVVMGSPKTSRSRRSLSLDPATLDALRRHGLRQQADRLQNGLGRVAQEDMIFVAPSGALMQPSAVGQRFQRLRRAHGLPHIRLHDLRHTYATLALEAGVHPKVVSERLGHAGITITLDLYAHVLPSIEKAAALQVSSLFVPPTRAAE